MKNLNLFAWISGIIALILMFLGFIDFLFSPSSTKAIIWGRIICKISPDHHNFFLSSFENLFYTGYTSNLQNRIKDHIKGKVASTKCRRPLILIYFESCLNQQDATRREKYLKLGNGKIYLKSRLRNLLKESNGVNTHVSQSSLQNIKSPLDLLY